MTAASCTIPATTTTTRSCRPRRAISPAWPSGRSTGAERRMLGIRRAQVVEQPHRARPALRRHHQPGDPEPCRRDQPAPWSTGHPTPMRQIIDAQSRRPSAARRASAAPRRPRRRRQRLGRRVQHRVQPRRTRALSGSGTGCAMTAPARPPRAPSARRRSPAAEADRRPCAAPPATAASPFRRNTRDRAAPGRTAWRTLSRRRGNARAVRRPPTAPPVPRLDRRGIAGWIHRRHVRQPDQMAAACLQRREVARLVARIAREILVGAELQRIDEDRRDDRGTGCAAARTSARCPSCSAPIVGTSARLPKRWRSAAHAGAGRRACGRLPCRELGLAASVAQHVAARVGQ